MLLPLPTTAARNQHGLLLLLRGGCSSQTTTAMSMNMMSMSSSPAVVPAAIAAPLATSLGIHVWDEWKGSAFALNAFKCTVATALFGVTLALKGTNPLSSFSSTAVRMLLLSSFCGIVVGDLLWLRALQLLGAQDTIVMSALHPVIAWFAGTFILKQRSSPLTVLGLFLVCTGVVYTQLSSSTSVKAIDNDEDDAVISKILKNSDGSSSNPNAASVREKRLLGYSLNLLNIILDVLGSVLTRRFGAGHSTFEICFVRFGFASVGIAIMAAAGKSFARIRGLDRPAWAALPTQSARTWVSMGTGVFLVTYLSPALGNYALFALPLAVWTALGSLGPVYSIPIKWIREGERTPVSGMLGAIMASGGSALLGMTSN